MAISPRCTSTEHDRRNCDRAYSNDEIGPEDWCPNCLQWAASRVNAAKRARALEKIMELGEPLDADA